MAPKTVNSIHCRSFLYSFFTWLIFRSLPDLQQQFSAILIIFWPQLCRLSPMYMSPALSYAYPLSSSVDLEESLIFQQQVRASFFFPSSQQTLAIYLQTSIAGPIPLSPRLSAQNKLLMLSSYFYQFFSEIPSLKAELKSDCSAQGDLSFLSSSEKWKYLEAISNMRSLMQMLPMLWQALDRSTSSHPHWPQIFSACVQFRRLS